MPTFIEIESTRSCEQVIMQILPTDMYYVFTIVFICTLSLYNFSTIKIWGKHLQIFCTVCNSFISLTLIPALVLINASRVAAKTCLMTQYIDQTVRPLLLFSFGTLDSFLTGLGKNQI